MSEPSKAQSVFALPYPPTVNSYWRRVGAKTLISRAGREYRKAVASRIRVVEPYTERLSVHVRAYMPDRRRRDLDNLPKAVLDSLVHAGAFADDEQIDRLTIERGPVDTLNPRVEITIEPLREVR